MKMRAVGITLVSVVATAAVVGNAYYHKKQFFPSVVFITKSNPSMAVIYIQSLVLVLMMGKLMRKIFLGTLRPAEFEHLMERFWYALTETCLAFTVFRDDFNPKFVALFTVLLFLKSFHWLAEDRVDYMERSPHISWLFHSRVGALLSVLSFLDFYMVKHAYLSTMSKGATVLLVFGFEYAILITMVLNTTIKYALHATELHSVTQWENKAVFLLYTELVIGFIRVILYVLFVVIMVRVYTLPLFAFRPMYYTMRNFKKALNDVILSRRAIRNMNTLYPDATSEELTLSDNICIICREDMVNSSKKLPCGHIFHTTCLRSWFQRQQTCPTCRLNILRAPAAANQPQAAPQPAPAAAPPAPANPPPANVLPNFLNNNNIQAPTNPFANLLANVAQQSTTANATPINPSTTPLVNGAPSATTTAAPPFLLPPFSFMPSFIVPPPPMPPALDRLSDDELRALEGTERRHVEERIKLLRNVQLMLDASATLMSQYNTVVARLPVPPPPAPVVTAEPTAVTVEQSTPSASVEPVATAAASVSATMPTPDDIDLVRIEDIGSEDHLAMPAASTAAAAATTSTSVAADDEPVAGPSSRASCSSTVDDMRPENAEAAELRRRRLQKFC